MRSQGRSKSLAQSRREQEYLEMMEGALLVMEVTVSVARLDGEAYSEADTIEDRFASLVELVS